MGHPCLFDTYLEDDFPSTEREISEIRERCHEYLRKAVGCHVSFLLFVRYAVFSCDDIIDRFLAASRSEDFSMPLSTRMEFGEEYRASKPAPEPTNCTQPTLRNVQISRKVLPRWYYRRTFTYDVYHFRNQRRNEWLTVCLGKYSEGRVDFVFLQKGRVMASVEDIDKMEPIPYPLVVDDDYDD
ncbi:hypothetical protein AAVH_23336 [Aphelenchoides avenae]|nr:hypothetical protein AAVH_23336 [Aphelenchus avenae]